MRVAASFRPELSNRYLAAPAPVLKYILSYAPALVIRVHDTVSAGELGLNIAVLADVI